MGLYVIGGWLWSQLRIGSEEYGQEGDRMRKEKEFEIWELDRFCGRDTHEMWRIGI